jgi:hypothetical protein
MAGVITLQMSMQEYYNLNSKKTCDIFTKYQTYKIVLDVPKSEKPIEKTYPTYPMTKDQLMKLDTDGSVELFNKDGSILCRLTLEKNNASKT